MRGRVAVRTHTYLYVRTFVTCRFMGSSSVCVDDKESPEARDPHHATAASAALFAFQGYGNASVAASVLSHTRNVFDVEIEK